MSTIAPTYDEFVASYPEFSGLTEPVIQAALNKSARILDNSTWGNYYDIAVGLDVAHNLAIRGLIGSKATGGIQAAVGPISSTSAAGVSTSFNTPSATSGNKNEEWYSKTAYGQEFLRLQQQVLPIGALCA